MENKKNDKVLETKRALLSQIQKMNLSESTKLPREIELAKQFNVSRTTIRAVLQELIVQGLVFSKQGKGTFVNREALQLKTSFSPIADLREVIQNNGYQVHVSTVNLGIRKGNDEELKKLNLKKGAKIFIIERVFFADDQPTVYCVDRIPIHYFKEDIQYREKGQSIFSYIEETLNRKIVWDKVELSTVIQKEKDFLSSTFVMDDPLPLLNCDIINYDEQDEAILYSNEYIDTRFIRFELIRMKQLK